MRARARSILAGVLGAALAGCAHEVVRLGPEAPALEPPEVPIGLTVAVVPGSFEHSRINAAGVVDHFARELRQAHLFQGVMFPVPPGADPTWEIELAGSDAAAEPDANFWKAFLANFLPPAALLVTLENDYTLDLEALLLHRRELVRSYHARAGIRHRYQVRADRTRMEAEGVEVVVKEATQRILREIAADAGRLERLNDLGP